MQIGFHPAAPPTACADILATPRRRAIAAAISP